LEAAAEDAVAEDTGAGSGVAAGCAGTGVTVVSGTGGVGRSDPEAGAAAGAVVDARAGVGCVVEIITSGTSGAADAGEAGAGEVGWGAMVIDAEAATG